MAFDRPGLPPLIILDANLLYPFHLRNLLVQFGVDSIISPRWTTRIKAEWIGNLVAAGRAPEEPLLLTLDLMNKALPEAEVRGWESRMEGLIPTALSVDRSAILPRHCEPRLRRGNPGQRGGSAPVAPGLLRPSGLAMTRVTGQSIGPLV